ncbi:YadA domain-containing protein [Actinobacillus indolicus]|nr:YadA domain-containing protein [Actinobacillus indolicus]VTU09663.1 YadA domain-containing protein [Actinobacillus indolicus]
MNSKVDQSEYNTFKDATVGYLSGVDDFMTAVDESLTILDTDLTAAEGKITDLETNKADKTTVEALTTTVEGKADKATVDALTTTVNSKVDQSEYNTFKDATVGYLSGVDDFMTAVDESLTILDTDLTAAEGKITDLETNKADKTTVEALTTTVEGKADKATVEALTTTVNGKVDQSEYNTFKDATVGYLAGVDDFMTAADESLTILDNDLTALENTVAGIQQGNTDALNAETKAKIDSVGVVDDAFKDIYGDNPTLVDALKMVHEDLESKATKTQLNTKADKTYVDAQDVKLLQTISALADATQTADEAVAKEVEKNRKDYDQFVSDVSTFNNGQVAFNDAVDEALTTLDTDLATAEEKITNLEASKLDKAEFATKSAAIQGQLDTQANKLAAEETTRAEAVKALNARVGAEETARAEAIATESSAREAADNAIKIDLAAKADQVAVNEIAKDVANNRKEYDQFVSDVSTFNSEQVVFNGLVDEALTTLDTDLATAEEKITNLEASKLDKAEFATKSAAIQGQLDTQANKLAAEETARAEAVKALNARVGAEETARTEAIAAESSAREAADEAIKINLATKADKTALEAVKFEVSVTKTNVQSVKDKADKNEAAVAKNQEKIASVEARVATKATKSEVQSVKEKADRNEANIAKNTAKISQVETAVQSNTVAINETKSDIAVNRANIAKNTKAIAHNSQRIDQLDRRVTKLNKEMREGLATQAALSGLFQPSTVGKVNVSAAVGGYKSQTAVAVGAGVRFNPNVAAKAGVAVSGNSVSYNAGVNFEW